MTEPKTLRAWRNRCVVMLSSARNNAGETISAGEVVYIVSAKSNGTFEVYRPSARISGLDRSSFRLVEGDRHD